MENGVLNSWKEIATYIGRGIRTVQRWEHELGFPVRRPRGKHRSAVIAIKHEIDLWMRTPHGAEAQRRSRHIALETHQRLVNNTETLHARAAILVSRTKVLNRQVARAIELGAAMRVSYRTTMVDRKNWAAEVAADSDLLKKAAAHATELGVALQNSAPPGEADSKLKPSKT